MVNAPILVTRWRDTVSAELRGSTCGENVRENLILAIIWQESEGNPWAYNPEPRYRWFWNVKKSEPFRKVSDVEIAAKKPPSDFPCRRGDPDQEWWGQQASWGLMQVMGAAAREQGFSGDYLPETCDPYTNIEFGIKHFWKYALRSGQESVEKGLLRWNGGGNPKYPDEVLAKLAEIEKVYPLSKDDPVV